MQIINKYTISDKVRLAWWLIRTKLLHSKARMIRRPFDIRGKEYIDLGNKLTTGRGCRLEAFSQSGNIVMRFGNRIQINDYVHISAMEGVAIGNDVLMASHIYISDNSHGSYKGDTKDSSPEITPSQREYFTKPVIIEDNVWLGEHVVVLPGVTIGRGSVVGANSIVSRTIPPYTISVGQPARPIKRYDFELSKWVKL